MSNHSHRSSPQWLKELEPFVRRSWGYAIAQIANSVIPYLAVFGLMMFGIDAGWSYWIVLPLAIPAALVLVRVFIIFHDCTHGSFTSSQKANRAIGYVTGALTFTSFETFRLSHLKHHATHGQLDHRGFGDVWTMTFEEYAAAPRAKRLAYRLYREPFVMFVLGSVYTFLVANRFLGLAGTPAQRRSTIATNLGIVTTAVVASLVFSFRAYLLAQLPIMVIAGMMGIWLFYIQHQFDPGYWARDPEWDHVEAALHGSSYYKLGPVLRWFTGNIGVHHVHHLKPRIPNYRLYKAYRTVPQTHIDEPLTFWKSLGAIRYNLWHEAKARFLSFREARRMLRASAQGRA